MRSAAQNVPIDWEAIGAIHGARALAAAAEAASRRRTQCDSARRPAPTQSFRAPQCSRTRSPRCVLHNDDHELQMLPTGRNALRMYNGDGVPPSPSLLVLPGSTRIGPTTTGDGVPEPPSPRTSIAARESRPSSPVLRCQLRTVTYNTSDTELIQSQTPPYPPAPIGSLSRESRSLLLSTPPHPRSQTFKHTVSSCPRPASSSSSSWLLSFALRGSSLKRAHHESLSLP